MPNYAAREKELLDEAEQALADSSRRPLLDMLDDAGLLALIAALGAARDKAATAAGPDGLSAADLLATARRRAEAERRKRKLRPDGTVLPGKTVMAALAAPRPAKDAKPAPVKRASAGARRTPPDRKSADPRKTDLRTGSRRIKKASPEVSAAVAAPAEPAPKFLTPLPVTAPPGLTKDRPAEDKQAAKDARKAARKAEKQAEKQAARAAEKAARKAARKAAKDAERALRKAETGGKAKAKAGAKPKRDKKNGDKQGKGKGKAAKGKPGKAAKPD